MVDDRLQVMKKIFIGNWKMNPLTLRKAKDLYSVYVKATKRCKSTDTVVCAPTIYLHPLHALKGVSGLSMGAQDVFEKVEGAYTGEVNVGMLKDAGVTHVIVGHSERRARGETNVVVNEKIKAAVSAGLQAIVCIGESERDTNGKFYRKLQRELEETLVGIEEKYLKKIIIAYEPIWTIGKSAHEAMDGERMYEMNIFIQKALTDLFGHEVARRVRVVYGGSVDKSNIENIVEDGKIDGVLVGRASLDAKQIKDMLTILDTIR